ncbi:PBSX family phage terminase large subunit [Staphylococcus americanisciuri]|uniref:PBSX family phage terminase large subunit n=1 Tax=Staphylococcus americanisciuri TaxID=2973940 RepID=A0ABT2F466_9STAP|nr:PBSX family phage terminase large subunit [Staphylococcus americanisciuri]MCS4487202.1 PBSX family phage terminase large subunit [Staphylococcus americanisciuri]
MTTSINLSELIPKPFHDIWRKTKDSSVLNIVAKGGRGSGKSSDISHIIVQLIMRYPVNAVVVRKTDNTLATSVFEQIKWAIEQQGVSHLFKVKVSPMELTYVPRGNRIIFRGAQNPERLKSLKDSRFPFSIMWIEELAEFKTEDEVTTITNSLLRGELGDGLFYKFFYSYNPPKRKQSWVNKKYESSFQPDNTFVHHSTYLDNPFISKQFIQEAEAAKQRNKLRYRWEYMGEAIGSGVVPFNNLQIENISDELYKSFDNIRNAVDFGYATDPLAFVRWHYDKKKRIIYAVDEYYGVQISNRQFAKWLWEKGYQSDDIYADSAEPKSIDELKKEHGIKRIKGVKKGADSVEYGEQWLDDLEAIVIDPKRTPNIAREFENIDYETDKDGNVKPRLEDKDNHTIDATRYAFERDMKQRKMSILK